MKERLPDNLLKDDKSMDEALSLSRIDPHQEWLHAVYQRIRLLEYLGYNYSRWEMNEELSASYLVLYMESLASVIETVLRATFHNKNIRYCDFRKCPYLSSCPVLFKEENTENASLSFYELITKAEEVGIFSSLDKNELHFIRIVRNGIHLDIYTDEKKKEKEPLTAEDINSSIHLLKKVIQECITWLYNPNLARGCKLRIMSNKIYI